MKAYLDNAATTPIDEQVIELMTSVMRETYGNPSSIHAQGRKAKTLIEQARKSIAKTLGVAPGEIFFTSCGTEADNMALYCAVNDLGCTHIITAKTEHHAVLYTAEHLAKKHNLNLSYVEQDKKGITNLEHLKELLESRKDEKTIVALMHANNEIGTLLDVQAVGDLCQEYGAYFLSDTVQTIGHLPVEPKKWGAHFLSASAHKFHGPKGVGFIYVDENVLVKPMFLGGSQERNLRAGTENIASIVGMAKALELAVAEMDELKEKISALRLHMLNRLQDEIPGVVFNGDYEGNANYISLSAGFPVTTESDMLLFNMDIAGIAASGGSACSSGSNTGSHVLRALDVNLDKVNIRFSFGKHTTKEEVDYAVDKVAELVNPQVRKSA